MKKGFLDRVKDNGAIRIWSERTQQEKGDSLTEGYELEFCFTFGRVDLVPIVEEHIALLCCPRIKVNKAYSRATNVPTFVKNLMNITGMNEQWVAAQIKQKGDSKCIPWKNLRDLILAHPDMKKRVDIFTLSIYGLVVFPKALGHVDEAVSGLFDRLDKGVTPVPAILAETFRSLNACRKELVATPRRDDHFEEKRIAILQNLQVEVVEWRAPWMIPDEILYRCGDFDWVPLLRIWGAIGYAPLLVLRQYRSRQMKRLIAGLMTTPEYDWWWSKRINENIPMRSQENTRPIEEHLQVIPSELGIIKQDFEKRSPELEKKIEQLEKEKMRLGLDVDIHKLEAENLRKGKNKAEENLDSLKTDYKKLRMSMRTVGLGKNQSNSSKKLKKKKLESISGRRSFKMLKQGRML
ncbi:hypothetical protein CXB51_024464 [Gossypium anomalum]|uniref:DUF7745 domain-containing protein n=1 Tax=Gossypium anomalum TaxID=47600 RepID=A0A8J6CSE1_9ROSI|nr:hypothetical protein CXB51_024464 [Gossypium anomalum]